MPRTERNPWPEKLHENDGQNQAKHRKMWKRLRAKKISKTCKWYRRFLRRDEGPGYV